MLAERLSNKRIVLASGSPRRQDLLRSLGLDFVIDTRPVEECYAPTLQAVAITDYLAELKAQAFEQVAENTLLITADTIVWHRGKALEKPRDRSAAISMLQALSNSTHQVITSVCIRTHLGLQTFNDSTLVTFRKLQEKEIIYYVDKYQPFDKAGSYGIQEWIGFVGIDRIEGSYFNVMGLPVHKLYEELLKL